MRWLSMPFHSNLHPRPGVGSLGAHVGTLSSRFDAAALDADREGRPRARRYRFSLILPSASTLDATPQALLRPRTSPQAPPAHAGSQVALVHRDAFRAASAGMASRLCLRTDRLRAFGRSSPAAPPHPRSTLSAPPARLPASCVHPSHRPHPTHRSRTRWPPSAAHTQHLHASRPPYPVLSSAGAQSCPLTLTRVGATLV